MKIKDGIVISKSDLEEWKKIITGQLEISGHYQTVTIKATISAIDKIILESKPLEPIISDAWKCEDSTLDDYINETDI